MDPITPDPQTTTTRPRPMSAVPLSSSSNRSSFISNKSTSSSFSANRPHSAHPSMMGLNLSTSSKSGLKSNAGPALPSPSHAKLQALSNKLNSSFNSSSELSKHRVKSAKKKEQKLDQLDDKLTMILAAHESEKRIVSEVEAAKYHDIESKVNSLQDSIDLLQRDFEAEESTRKHLNSTFAKNYAVKMEERFIKIENLLAAQKTAFEAQEQEKLKYIKTLESRVQELESSLEQEKAARLSQSKRDELQWETFQEAIDRLEKQIEETRESRDAGSIGGSSREELSVLKREVSSLRDRLEDEASKRLRNDEEHISAIREGVQFIKEGKESWLRMLDYKLTPYKVAREEEVARQSKRDVELESHLSTIAHKLEELHNGIETERSSRDEAISSVQISLEKESAIREETEEALTKLLEQTINRLDQVANELIDSDNEEDQQQIGY